MTSPKILGTIEIECYSHTTIEELITKLKKYPPNSKVYLKLDRDYYGEIDGSFIQIIESE